MAENTADGTLCEDYTRRPTVTATTPSAMEKDRQLSNSIAITETTLPVACTALPVHSRNGDATQQDTVSSSHQSSKQTQSPSTVPHSRMRSLSPSSSISSPSSSSSSPFSSSDSSPRHTTMLSGAQKPTPQQIKTLLESYFSDSTSSDAEENLETVLSAVLHDPLESSMQGIEDLATGILRTGKLSVQGEAGDMSKLQPILLGLQASERETAQLLPQLMQVPFFEQVETDNRSWVWSSNGHRLVPEDFLACGHIRLGLPIDTAIYHLLNRHCAKGARQAEAVIQLSQTVEYTKNLGSNLLPALICSATVLSSPSPPLHDKFVVKLEKFATEKSEEVQCSLPSCDSHALARRQRSGDSGVLCDHTDTNYLQPSATSTSNKKGLQRARDESNSSLLTNSDYQSSQISTSSASLPFSPLSSFSSLPMVHSLSVDAGGDRIKTIVEEGSNGSHLSDSPSPMPPAGVRRRRKTSLFQRPSLTGSEVSDDGISTCSLTSSTGRLMFDRNQWNTTIMDNNMIVGMFGDTTYPLLMWNNKLRLDFEISSSAGFPGMIIAVDPKSPVLNIRLHNPTPHRIGFSIRAHRQTCVHSSHVIYPLNGLHVLEPAHCWEESADIHQDSLERNEYIIVELFFATLEANQPSWNVLRRYAVMKANKKRQSHGRPSRGNSNFQMPGTAEKKHDNLRQLIAHGLQCVVKNKHSAAEIILTQALFLPDFQRIELKAFVYICLAVVAYRRQKAGEIESLTHTMKLVNSVDKLIDACEAPRTIRMPRTVLLVKQLRKELNFSDIVKSIRKKDRHKHMKLVSHYSTEGSTTLMCEEGGFLVHQNTSLLVPRGSLKSQAEITLSGHDHKQLQTMLVSTGWDKTVRIVCAVHVECDTSVSKFKQAVQIQTMLPEQHTRRKSLQSLTSLPLLLHSSYLRRWDDITHDAASSVSISEGAVQVTTDRVGWLAVALVDADPIRIASMAMQALSISPTTLQVCVFGQRFPDDVMQITVLMSPTKDDEDVQKDAAGGSEYKGSIDHKQISFPYLIQAYPGEELRCRLKGLFEPDANSGETDLDFHFRATQFHDSLNGKFIHLTAPFPKCRGGNLVISRHLASDGSWENIANISVVISKSNSSTRSCRGSRSTDSQM